MRKASLAAALFICLFCFTAFCTEAKPSGKLIYPGYRSLAYSLPGQHILLKLSVWYPTRRKPRTVKEGDWVFRAARSAPILPGPWPLIVISHGNSGTSLSHHDLAAAFSTRGYIVVAPTHDHDNADDMRMLFHDLELGMRAVQIRSAADFILEHPQIGPEIDRGRITYLGFGTPASAGLLLAGAQTTADEWGAFCGRTSAEKKPPSTGESSGADILKTKGSKSSKSSRTEKHVRLKDRDKDRHTGDGPAEGALPEKEISPSDTFPDSPWCRGMLAYRMERLVKSMRIRTREAESKKNYAAAASADRERLFERFADHMEKNHRRIVKQAKGMPFPQPPVVLPLLPPPSNEATLRDPRFSAFILVSPGYSFLFDKASLLAVRHPVLCIGSQKDDINIPQEQAGRFAGMMSGNARYALLQNTYPHIFDAPCPEDSPMFPLPAICGGSEEARAAARLAIMDMAEEFLGGRSNPEP